MGRGLWKWAEGKDGEREEREEEEGDGVGCLSDGIFSGEYTLDFENTLRHRWNRQMASRKLMFTTHTFIHAHTHTYSRVHHACQALFKLWVTVRARAHVVFFVFFSRFYVAQMKSDTLKNENENSSEKKKQMGNKRWQWLCITEMYMERQFNASWIMRRARLWPRRHISHRRKRCEKLIEHCSAGDWRKYSNQALFVYLLFDGLPFPSCMPTRSTKAQAHAFR